MNKRFLVIDDDTDDRELFTEALALVDPVIVCDQATDGAEALKQLATKGIDRPDIIFLDINMPVMNGWQFLDNFIALNLPASKHITIYMITSSVDNAEILRAASYKEIKNYIIKPISFDNMKEIFNNIKPQ